MSLMILASEPNSMYFCVACRFWCWNSRSPGYALPAAAKWKRRLTEGKWLSQLYSRHTLTGYKRFLLHTRNSWRFTHFMIKFSSVIHFWIINCPGFPNLIRHFTISRRKAASSMSQPGCPAWGCDSWWSKSREGIWEVTQPLNSGAEKLELRAWLTFLIMSVCAI